jgi:hypothetical protein
LTVNVELKAVRDKVAADEKTLNSLDWSKGLQAIKKLLGPLIVTPEEEEVIIECEGQSQKRSRSCCG